MVAATATGELCHQIFVVVETEAERGNGDVLFAEGLSERTEFARRAGADIRLAIGQQNDAIDVFQVHKLAKLCRALADAGEECRVAAGADAGNCISNSRLVAEPRCGNEDFYGRVVP